MVVESVLFDLDDTLFDHRHARLAGLGAIRQRNSTLSRVPLTRLDRVYERILSEVHVSLVLSGQMSQEESRLLRMERFLDEFDVPTSQKQIRELTDVRARAYQRNRRAVPGAVALLQAVRESGAEVGVVTNNLRSEQEEKLRIAGLEGLVDHLVCSEQVGVTKPHPRIFRVALKKTHSQPTTSVMVGDSWTSDVLGAIHVGIRAVWFHRDSRPLPTTPAADELRSLRPLAKAVTVIMGRRRRSPRSETRRP